MLLFLSICALDSSLMSYVHEFMSFFGIVTSVQYYYELLKKSVLLKQVSPADQFKI